MPMTAAEAQKWYDGVPYVWEESVMREMYETLRRGDSRAARPWGPVDARLEGRVALADGSVRIVLECVHLHEKNAAVIALLRYGVCAG